MGKRGGEGERGDGGREGGREGAILPQSLPHFNPNLRPCSSAMTLDFVCDCIVWQYNMYICHAMCAAY